MACYNPLLAEKRRQKRDKLLAATEVNLNRLARSVSRRTSAALGREIGVKAVGGRASQDGQAHRLTISDGAFTWSVMIIQLNKKVCWTDLRGPTQRAGRAAVGEASVRCTSGCLVEQLFRCLKGSIVEADDHRMNASVRHVLICVLAYYVEWHLRRRAILLFADEELDRDRQQRDRWPAKPSASVRRKKLNARDHQGLPVHSFRTCWRTWCSHASDVQ